MIESQRASDVPARAVDGAPGERQGDECRREEESTILLDEGVCLGRGTRELLGRVAHEVQGRGSLDEEMDPEGRGGMEERHFRGWARD